MAEEKTVSIKFHPFNVPRIHITYRNKKDLYETLQKELKALKLPISKLYRCDWDDDPTTIKNANDLLGAVQNNSIVVLYYETTNENDVLSCPSFDEENQEPAKSEAPKKEESETRSPSPARRRHRSRSVPCRETRHHGPPDYYQMPWNFGPWNYMMDPRYGPMPFPPYSQLSSKDHRGRRRERSRHCSCERMCKEFNNL